MAVAFVASPLYVRQAIATFEAVDPNLVAASRTLGAGPVKTFFRVVLPLARGGLAAGEALAFARGLGEFGATIMFAGSLRGVTQTLPLAIYAEFDVNFDDRARDQRPARARQRGAPRHRQARPPMAALSADFSLPLRAFDLELSARGRAARSRSSGRRARARRRCCASSRGSRGRARGRVALGDEVWLDTTRRIDLPPGGAARRPRLPGVRALPAPERARERRLRGRRPRRRVARALPRRAPRRRATRASSRAASSSASRSPARSPATRRSCCSTSRSPRSTRTRRRRCGAS